MLQAVAEQRLNATAAAQRNICIIIRPLSAMHRHSLVTGTLLLIAQYHGKPQSRRLYAGVQARQPASQPVGFVIYIRDCRWLTSGFRRIVIIVRVNPQLPEEVPRHAPSTLLLHLR